MLNDQEIMTRSVEKCLITPFNNEQLQGHSYDCLLSKDIKIPRLSKKGKHLWKTIDIQKTPYSIKHCEFLLGATVETFKLPDNVTGFVCGKSTLGRNGLQIENAGFIDAGFSGNITLELFNMAPWDIELKAGTAICQVIFFSTKNPTIKPYSKIGHYNGQSGVTIPVYEL